MQRAKEASQLAFSYVMTDNEAYARKAKESLLQVDGSIRLNRYWGFRYGWAFDWIFNYLNDHDGEDLNGNGKSDLAEIQEKLIKLAVDAYSGGAACDRPPEFGGADHQTHGEGAVSPLAIMFSSLGYNETITADKDIAGSRDIYSRYHGADHFCVEALGHKLGYPDPSRYGHTSFYNDDGIPCWYGVMYGAEGMFDEGPYYSTAGTSYTVMAMAEHLGIDMSSQEYLHALPDFYIKTMAPDRTYPFYGHSIRAPFANIVHAARLYKESNGDVYMWYGKDVGVGFGGLAGILTFDQELYDKAAPPDSYWDSPTHFLPKAGVAVLRSGWSRDANYLMLVGRHRTSDGLMSAHNEGDATDINLFAKGEYLIVNTDDGRFSDGRIYLTGGDYADVDDIGAWRYPWGEPWGMRPGAVEAREERKELLRERRKKDGKERYTHEHNFMLHGPVGCNMIRIDDLDYFRQYNVPGKLQSRRRTIDRGYIENTIDTKFMDYAEVRGHLGDLHELVPEISTIDINRMRSILFPHEEYFIIVDDLKSLNGASHRYSFAFHLAGKRVETNTLVNGDPKCPLLKLDGTLSVGGREVKWDKKDTSDADCDANCFWPRYDLSGEKELVWVTKNYRDQDIALKVFFVTPQVDITVERGDGNYLRPRNFSAYINPYVQAYVENKRDVKFLAFLYPWEIESEPEPTIADIQAEGGYGGKLTLEGRRDLVVVKDDLAGEVTADGIRTDARIAFCSDNGKLNYYFIRDGSSFAYQGKDELAVSERVDYLILKRDGERRIFRVKGEGNDVKITLHRMSPDVTYQVKRDGQLYSDWKMTDGEMAIRTDVQEHEFTVEAGAG